MFFKVWWHCADLCMNNVLIYRLFASLSVHTGDVADIHIRSFSYCRCLPSYCKYEFYKQPSHSTIGRVHDKNIYWDDVNVILSGEYTQCFTIILSELLFCPTCGGHHYILMCLKLSFLESYHIYFKCILMGFIRNPCILIYTLRYCTVWKRKWHSYCMNI